MSEIVRGIELKACI